MTVVVAGGTKGIGLAIARRLGADDGRVVLGYANDHESARSACAALAEEGIEAEAIAVDLGTPQGARDLVARVDGPISQLVHSCVQLGPSFLLDDEDTFDERWSASLAVNGHSLLWLARSAMPHLARGSSILYVGSRGSSIVVHGYASVGPPKALGDALVRYLAVELAPRGIRVNGLAPGIQDSDTFRKYHATDGDEILAAYADRTPAGRLVSQEDYTEAAAFLSSPGAQMVTGQMLNVYGGLDLIV